MAGVISAYYGFLSLSGGTVAGPLTVEGTTTVDFLNITGDGSGPCLGTATLVGGSVTVNTESVDGGTTILLQNSNPSAVNVGTLRVVSISGGSGFDVSSTNVLDTSTFYWALLGNG